jgi:hypothetical protein
MESDCAETVENAKGLHLLSDSGGEEAEETKCGEPPSSIENRKV